MATDEPNRNQVRNGNGYELRGASYTEAVVPKCVYRHGSFSTAIVGDEVPKGGAEEIAALYAYIEERSKEHYRVLRNIQNKLEDNVRWMKKAEYIDEQEES